MTEHKDQNENESSNGVKLKDRIIVLLAIGIPWIIIITAGVINFRENEAEAKKKNDNLAA